MTSPFRTPEKVKLVVQSTKQVLLDTHRLAIDYEEELRNEKKFRHSQPPFVPERCRRRPFSESATRPHAQLLFSGRKTNAPHPPATPPHPPPRVRAHLSPGALACLGMVAGNEEQ